MKPFGPLAFSAAILCVASAPRAHSQVTPQVISQCANLSTGVGRFVHSAANCQANEGFVQWNAVGATGAAGATGATGPVGPQGPAGSGEIVKDANGNALGTLIGVSTIGSSGGGGSITIYKSGYTITVNPDGTFNPASIYWSNGSLCNGTGYYNTYSGGYGGYLTYYHTVVWSGATNSFYTTGGPVTANMVTSVTAPGTTITPIPEDGGSTYDLYTSPDHSIENPGQNSDGGYGCGIHQSYQGSVLDSVSNGIDSGYGGFMLTPFSPQDAMGWPAFVPCTVISGPNFNSQTLGVNGTFGTATSLCLAGPLQMPETLPTATPPPTR